jgi:chromosome segregation ATPase
MGAFSMTRPGRTRAIAALLLAILVALGGVGCGGGSSDRLSKSEYEAKVKSIGKDLQTSLNTFNSNNKDLGALETKVGQAQTKLQSAASQLKGLKPPSDAEADTKKLAAGLTGLANQFNSLKQALASGDLAKVQQTANAFKGSPAAADAKAATEDLKKKGYDVGVFGT